MSVDEAAAVVTETLKPFAALISLRQWFEYALELQDYIKRLAAESAQGFAAFVEQQKEQAAALDKQSAEAQAVLAGLQKEVEAARGELEDLKGAAAPLQQALNAKRQELADTQGRLDNVRNELAALKSRL